MISDMGDGIFDAAWFVSNFDNLNPANTLWTKQYNVWANPEQEKNRYLRFENVFAHVLIRGRSWNLPGFGVAEKV